MTPYDKLLEEAGGRPFACIVGWPVEHSRSPALHGFWLKQHGVDGHYGRLPVEPVPRLRSSWRSSADAQRARLQSHPATRSTSCRCWIAHPLARHMAR
jgi:hypothetical protein